MKTLVSVAVDGDGNILTIDSQNHCIYKFTPDGQEQAKIGTKGNRPLQFRWCPFIDRLLVSDQ